ncbi:MAG TPA: SDR family oxidoreductase, partial [Gemmatimonadaceae bacterium]|nr:SDR family oxidoreductase [Gemmatimonadaceae bacterium]
MPDCKPVTTSMHGKICVITGANTGIGKAAAEALAALGAQIIMICRNRAKGERALADIAAAAAKSGRGGGAELAIADLSSQAEIRSVASGILAAHPRIDVLVNNAGVALNRRELTVDGIERTFAVNYLAYFMLANLLLPGLRAAGSARIVNVASNAHRRGTLDFDNLQGERSYRNLRMYSESKLEDVMFTYALARRLAGTGVTANALHPGVVATEIWRQVPVLDFLSRWLMLSPEKGARTTVYLAASPDVQGVTGQYFDKCKPASTIELSHDVALQE